MWLKILSGIVSVAKMTGLDKKVKDWVLNKLNNAEDKVVDKLVVVQDKVDELREKLDDVEEPTD